MGDVVREFVELCRGRELSIEQQPTYFEIAALLDEFGDRIAAVEQNPVVAIDISDRRTADPGLAQGRIVGEVPDLLVKVANIDHRCTDGRVEQRQLGPHIAAADADFGRLKMCRRAHGFLHDGDLTR